MEKLKEIRKNIGLSQKEVASTLNITVGTYSKIERGEIQLTVERLLQLSTLFNLSPNDIIYFDNYTQNDKNSNPNISYIPVTAQAGLLNEFSIDEDSNDILRFFLPTFYERDLFMLNLEGDSMYPTFSSGDYILVQKIEKPINIAWGKPYLIVTATGQVVKRIYQGIVDSKLLLSSDNKTFPPYEIELASIIGLWELKGVLSRNLSPRRN